MDVYLTSSNVVIPTFSNEVNNKISSPRAYISICLVAVRFIYFIHGLSTILLVPLEIARKVTAHVDTMKRFD